MSTTIHIPCKTGAWGDNVPSIWIGEYIKHFHPEIEITFNDNLQNLIYHRDYLEMPWVKEFSLNGTHLLATHHRHVWDEGCMYPSHRPLVFFDCYSLYYVFEYHNWYPTFRPTQKTLREFYELNLPLKFNILHLRANEGDRNKLDPKEWYQKYKHTLNNGYPTYTTDIDIEGLPSISHAAGWVKIYAMIQAEQVWSSLTGFTSIAAVYRKKKKIKLINFDFPKYIAYGPPFNVYENIITKVDPKDIYYSMHNEQIKNIDYENYYENYTMQHRNVISLYETLDYNQYVKAPAGYEIPKFSLKYENGLVPRDIAFAAIDDDGTFHDFVTLESVMRLDGYNMGYKRQYGLEFLNIWRQHFNY